MTPFQDRLSNTTNVGSGLEVKTDDAIMSPPLKHTTPSSQDDSLSTANEMNPPSLFQRVRTFAGALVGHVKDGMTKCSEDEIQARLAVCQSCPSFTGSHCKECGCACSAQSRFFNKLAWRSESCPLGKWSESDPSAEGTDPPNETAPPSSGECLVSAELSEECESRSESPT